MQGDEFVPEVMRRTVGVVIMKSVDEGNPGVGYIPVVDQNSGVVVNKLFEPVTEIRVVEIEEETASETVIVGMRFVRLFSKMDDSVENDEKAFELLED